MIPKNIRRLSARELSIIWDDGHTGRHTMQVLRRYCPCASCKMEMETPEGSPILPILKQGQFELTSIDLVGKYAVQLTWADGHRTGIYTFDHLRQLCECDDCTSKSAE